MIYGLSQGLSLSLGALGLAAGASAASVARNGGYWCALPRESGASSARSLEGEGVSFRGEYRDFDLFVEGKDGGVGQCAVFKTHELGCDGLWVVEEPSVELFEKTKAKLVAAGLPVYFETGLSMVVGGAEHVPDVSGLDGCGADEDTSIIPVPSHSVSIPQLSAQRLQEWAAIGERRQGQGRDSGLDSGVSDAVAMVNEKSLTASIEALQAYNSRNSYSETIYEAQAYISKRLEELGFEVELIPFRLDMSPNVVATWPRAVPPAEWVIAGAHYDSRSQNSSSTDARAPGADDNGSGTSCMLELASIVNATSLDSARGLKICFFSGEEQGLLGSQALASVWSEEGKSIAAMVNADMLGYQAGEEITLGFKDRNVTPELVTLAKQLTGMYVPSLPTADSSSCCSDYLSFYENGFPSVGFFESGMAASDYPSYHTDTDLLTYVNTKQLTLETQAVVATVYTLLG
jgi:hypothetical protein